MPLFVFSQLLFVFLKLLNSWIDFKDQMGSMLAESDRKGIMVPRVKKSTRKGSIYSNPLPECRCLWESKRTTNRSNSYLMVDH